MYVQYMTVPKYCPCLDLPMLIIITKHEVFLGLKIQIIKRRGNLQNQQNADVKTAATRQCYVGVHHLFSQILKI